MQQSYELFFVSSNTHKFEEAQRILSNLGLEINLFKTTLEEIQSNSIGEIAKRKALDAFSKLEKPVIIEDDCFIGARSEVAEGVVVETGAVLSMGVFVGASTKVIDRNTGEIFVGRVPAYSVVVPGTLPGKQLPDGSQGPSLYCAVIVKKVDAQTRSKTSVNELLRD